MGAESVESLIRRAQENPEQLHSEAEALIAQYLEREDCVRLFTEASDRFEYDWETLVSLRKSVDESLNNARKTYRDVLKKTESAGLQGQPKLYWLGKVLFAKLRKQSLQYQIQESEIKIAALKSARDELVDLLKRVQSDTHAINLRLIEDRDAADVLSKKHAVDLQVQWEKSESASQQKIELAERADRFEIEQAVADAVVSEMQAGEVRKIAKSHLRKIDSPKMLTSRLPHVGFSNRPKLMTLLEKGEYSAAHAERDLDKVREGIKLAAEAAVQGQATSVTREWLQYCRTIVGRYEQLAESDATPH